MDSDVMWSVFGGYYTFEEAVSGYNGGQICPDGWRLPSENDWADLAASLAVRPESVDSGETYPGIVSAMMADVFFNDEKMWSYDPQSAPSNTSGFSAIPAGYNSQGQFSGLNVYSMFWSSDVYEGAASEGGVYHYIYYKNADLKMNYADTASGLPCAVSGTVPESEKNFKQLLKPVNRTVPEGDTECPAKSL